MARISCRKTQVFRCHKLQVTAKVKVQGLAEKTLWVLSRLDYVFTMWWKFQD